MLKRLNWKMLCVVSCLALVGAYGCGDDNNSGGGGGPGGPTQSSFDINVTTPSGTNQYEGTQPDSQAGQGNWGAVISDETVEITFIDTMSGTLIDATVVTSEQNRAPGDFVPTSDALGTHVALDSAAAGESYESNGTGTISIDNCPRVVGEHIRGSFNNVEVVNSSGSGTWTLDGSFDVVVWAKSGDLFCEQASSNNGGTNNGGTNNGGTNNGGTNNGNVCRADRCVEGGVCCPYIDCVQQCEYNCLFEDAECAGGANPSACAACANGCLDECGVSQECRTAIVDLNTCSEANSCDAASTDEAQQECIEGNCCSELNAAL